MSFIRTDVTEALVKWRAALIGAAVALAGMYFVAFSGGILWALGGFAALCGFALTWDGMRRARFPAPGGGFGVVEVDERRITYFGPDGGNSISLNEITRITVNSTDQAGFFAKVYWEFLDRSGQRLIFPGDAEGAEKIFDALATFQGADLNAVTQADTAVETKSFLIWEDRPRALTTRDTSTQR